MSIAKVGRLTAAYLLAAFGGREEDVAASFRDHLTPEQVKDLAQADPSGNLKYLRWAAEQVAQGAAAEDVKALLGEFHQQQARLDPPDIYAYTAPSLRKALRALPPVTTTQRDVRQLIQSGKEFLGEKDGWKLYRSDTTAACINLGKGTQWCVSGLQDNEFPEYQTVDVKFYVAVGPKETADEHGRVARFAMGFTPMGVEYFDAANDAMAPEALPPPVRALFAEEEAARAGDRQDPRFAQQRDFFGKISGPKGPHDHLPGAPPYGLAKILVRFHPSWYPDAFQQIVRHEGAMVEALSQPAFREWMGPTEWRQAARVVPREKLVELWDELPESAQADLQRQVESAGEMSRLSPEAVVRVLTQWADRDDWSQTTSAADLAPTVKDDVMMAISEEQDPKRRRRFIPFFSDWMTQREIDALAREEMLRAALGPFVSPDVFEEFLESAGPDMFFRVAENLPAEHQAMLREAAHGRFEGSTLASPELVWAWGEAAGGKADPRWLEPLAGLALSSPPDAREIRAINKALPGFREKIVQAIREGKDVHKDTLSYLSKTNRDPEEMDALTQDASNSAVALMANPKAALRMDAPDVGAILAAGGRDAMEVMRAAMMTSPGLFDSLLHSVLQYTPERLLKKLLPRLLHRIDLTPEWLAVLEEKFGEGALQQARADGRQQAEDELWARERARHGM